MSFLNSPIPNHDQPEQWGVLLVNLGTPSAPNRRALKQYLKPFLSDPRVVEPTMPRWLWWLILNGVILNVRPGKSAHAYQQVWDHYGAGTGSPLMHVSQQQLKGIASVLGDDFHCELAMTYGQPSIDGALKRLHQKNISRLVVLPLYPQYSATTTAAVFDQVTRSLQRWRLVPEWRMVHHYHDDEAYIQSLVQSVQSHWQSHGQANQLIMSFHGIPVRYLKQGDPYFCHCHKTGRLLAEALGLEKHQWRVTFQSIFGREPWLQPYTNETLKQLAKEGVESVQVMCPGFSADCLETLEEIAMENRDVFIEAGGQQYQYISALNDNQDHIECLSQLIKRQTQGWQKTTPNQAAYSAQKKALNEG